MVQAELVATKENLQAAIEELQTSNEELQAANEELLASNEELQSTNEELQSVNEELYTVNAEYQRKIGELTALTNDMDNLLSSTDVGTIFLDKDLEIRRFTPQIAETFSLVPHDIGRPIATFAHTMDYPQLIDDLQGVPRQLRAHRARVARRARQVVLPPHPALPRQGDGRRRGPDPHRRERSQGRGGRALPRAAPPQQPPSQRPRRDLLPGREGPVHPHERADGGAARRLRRTRGPWGGRRSSSSTSGRTRPHRGRRRRPRTGEAQHLSAREARRSSDGDAWDTVTRLPIKNKSRSRSSASSGCSATSPRSRTRRRSSARRCDGAISSWPCSRTSSGTRSRRIAHATELLKTDAGSVPERRARVMGVLDRQSSQMARLLDDLLEASRVTQNKIELRICGSSICARR